MTQPERTLVRDRERTRRKILEAAERAIEQQGAGVSLAEIATLAGVTKSGLLHHFSTRDALIEAVFDHTMMRTWEEVRAQVDITENRPGKFTRAYVRAFTGDSDYLNRVASPTGLYAALGTHMASPSHNAAQQIDAQAWTAAFEADGLPIGRVLAIRYAAEGLVASLGSPYLTTDDLARVREELLTLTEMAPSPASG